MTTTTKTEKAADLARAEEWLADIKPGDTIRTAMTHVSSSGMTRHIRVFRGGQDGIDIQDISWPVAKLLDYPVNVGRHEGVKIGGAGMDMGFAIVYSLSRHLFPDGFRCIALDSTDPDEGYRSYRCPSNDHSNREENEWHRDGGYALIHRWL